MSIEIISGDLFNSDAQYIAQQCNCITQKAAHLSASMFKRFPYADIYSERKTPDQPGTIIIRGNGIDQRLIINMLGQYYPGKPKYPDSDKDGFKARQKYFFQCLKKIAEIPALNSIDFPHGIGCGAAGGDWDFYYGLLDKFAQHLDGRARVRIIQLPEVK